MRFPVVLHTDDGTRYGVTVPDLPGCFSAGDTLDDALASAVEAIELHVEGLIEEGDVVPPVHPVSYWHGLPEYADGVWAVVDVDVEKLMGPAEKVNITVPALMLLRIDRFAERTGESRSGLLVRAVTELIARQVELLRSATRTRASDQDGVPPPAKEKPTTRSPDAGSW